MFDGSASTDPDGYIVLYTFEFDDGSPEEISADPVATHVYTDPGLYEVTLSVIDDRDDKSSQIVTILIE